VETLDSGCRGNVDAVAADDDDVMAVTALSTDLQQPKTRNSSGDEIANVNFITDDIVHTLQNRPTIETHT